MTEIAQLFESALRQNQAKAAMSTVARMPPETTLRELIESDAGEAVRCLSLRDLARALREAGLSSRGTIVGSMSRGGAPVGRKRVVAAAPSEEPVWPESRDVRMYLRILDAVAEEPLTIGQLAKRLELTSDDDKDELRKRLKWMKDEGKIVSSGRARATRYAVAPESDSDSESE